MCHGIQILNFTMDACIYPPKKLHILFYFKIVRICNIIQRNDLKRKEKILKELEKKYEIEKNKIAKLEANLNSTEEELKTTKKVTYRFCLMRFALRLYCKSMDVLNHQTKKK